MQVDVDRWQFTSSLMGSLPAAYWQLTGSVLAAFGQLIGSLLAAYWQLTGNSRAAYWQITSQTGTEWMASTTPQMLTPHRTKRCKNKAKQSYANQTRTCHGTEDSGSERMGTSQGNHQHGRTHEKRSHSAENTRHRGTK